MKISIIVLTGVVGIIILCILFAPTREVRTEIVIDAAVDRVWAELTDNESYSEWNPFIVRMEGELVEGGRLTNTLRPQSGSKITFSPVGLKVVEDREFRWLGMLVFPRVFDGEHFFLLSGEGRGTRLVHGEFHRYPALVC